MADTMQFDLVSPERSLASLQAASVQIPGAEGDMTAMPDHAPLITTLRPGVLSVEGPDGSAAFMVTGGFAQISDSGTSVLAEKAVPVSEVTAEMIDGLIADAQATAEGASGATRDVANKLVSDLADLKGAVGV